MRTGVSGRQPSSSGCQCNNFEDRDSRGLVEAVLSGLSAPNASILNEINSLQSYGVASGRYKLVLLPSTNQNEPECSNQVSLWDDLPYDFDKRGASG